ncbi:MAG: hypothetical protein A2Z83_01445 [Omnitrophica bacterium GWA2_52_8]|nr:MAG: hypothetical protein A2Z83_01445 [Omnitrophica bacterium GWA2_52_8]
MPIQLDLFQQNAIDAIRKNHSVLVSAPTGAGKTLIAEAAINKALSQQKTVVYTAPIKALSNQKFRDFQALYPCPVGILTGDVSIRPDAPILIMTTEIYRNKLFEHAQGTEHIGWVIFDEIHYMDDPERGTVWEEAILFTPEETNILALSATAPNIGQIAEWIKSIHPSRPLTVVEEEKRPVPLHFLFQCQGKILRDMPQLFREGYLNRDSWRLSSRERRRGMRPLKPKPNRLDHHIEHLLAQQHLPAIHFVFGRKQTEFLAWEAARFDFLKTEERAAITADYDQLIAKYEITAEKSAQDLRPLIQQGIAYHHAGMLPTLKEVVERLFTSRQIKLIFTTETFALGINMPARSVIFDELSKFYGKGFQYLTTRDFYQMAGRAGRRGLDAEGFVYSRINPSDIAFSDIKRILHGKPEPIRSQLNTSYATLLNLYRDLGQKLIEIYPKTFHHFQSHTTHRREGHDLIKNRLLLLEHMGYLNTGGLTAKGHFAADYFGYELILTEMNANGFLDQLSAVDLSAFLSSLIYEPRKKDAPPHLKPKHADFQLRIDQIFTEIFRNELRHRIPSHRLRAHFHLARTVESWAQGEKFHRLFRHTHTDEGELVRHLRMIIQLLRDLMHGNETSENLRKTAGKAFGLINRDIVDAEKQLRIH